MKSLNRLVFWFFTSCKGVCYIMSYWSRCYSWWSPLFLLAECIQFSPPCKILYILVFPSYSATTHLTYINSGKRFLLVILRGRITMIVGKNIRIFKHTQPSSLYQDQAMWFYTWLSSADVRHIERERGVQSILPPILLPQSRFSAPSSHATLLTISVYIHTRDMPDVYINIENRNRNYCIPQHSNYIVYLIKIK
jgi:hypothetical protein